MLNDLVIVRVLLKREPCNEFGQAQTSRQSGFHQVLGNREMRIPFLQCKMATDLGGGKAELMFKKWGGLELRLCSLGQIIEASWFLHQESINKQC